MYVRYCLVEIARKSVTEINKYGKEILRYGPILFCGGAKVSSSAMIVRG